MKHHLWRCTPQPDREPSYAAVMSPPMSLRMRLESTEGYSTPTLELATAAEYSTSRERTRPATSQESANCAESTVRRPWRPTVSQAGKTNLSQPRPRHPDTQQCPGLAHGDMMIVVRFFFFEKWLAVAFQSLVVAFLWLGVARRFFLTSLPAADTIHNSRV